MTRPAHARSSYTVDFNGKSPRRATQAATGRIPRVARTLALAHRIDGMIRAGELRNLADAARAIGVTRARMTQIVNLLLLAPEIQEAILDLPPVTYGRETDPCLLSGFVVFTRRVPDRCGPHSTASPAGRGGVGRQRQYVVFELCRWRDRSETAIHRW